MNKQQKVMSVMRNFQRVLADTGSMGEATATIDGMKITLNQDGIGIFPTAKPAKKATKKAPKKKAD